MAISVLFVTKVPCFPLQMLLYPVLLEDYYNFLISYEIAVQILS